MLCCGRIASDRYGLELASLRREMLDGGVPVYLVESAYYFAREAIYPGEPFIVHRFVSSQ